MKNRKQNETKEKKKEAQTKETNKQANKQTKLENCIQMKWVWCYVINNFVYQFQYAS